MTQTAEAETIQRLRLLITTDGAKAQKEAKVGSAPGTRSPSPAALAASYTQVRGDINLSPATLRNLEMGREKKQGGAHKEGQQDKTYHGPGEEG